jgi:CHAT domain-containing protein
MFSADLWLVIDAQERPDLWALVRQGTIHLVRCPNAHPIKLDFPLLLNNERQTRLILSPPKATSTREQVIGIAAMLMGQLQQALPAQVYEVHKRRLEVVAREALPAEMSDHPKEFQAIIDALEALYKPTDMPRRIQLWEKAISLTNRVDDPELWAKCQVELALSYTEHPFGEHSENLERAIAAFEDALTVFTRDAFPEEWSTAQHNIGIAFFMRVKGERAENIERAIAIHQDALTARPRELYPMKWAATQNELGLEYRDRILGNRAENIERAIECFEAALTVFTFEEFPDAWARTYGNLGIAYAVRIKGERAVNLEQATNCYKGSLMIYQREKFPEEWARAQDNLGSAYSKRIRGDKAENLELAISAYKAALTVYTRKANPREWARVKNNLGSTYLQRLKGVPANNIELAIRSHEDALSVFTRHSLPEQWAATQDNLASAYSQRIKGLHADNLEKAIEVTEAALAVYTREAFPFQWAMILNNLGKSYIDRIRGDRATNIEKALEALEAALTVRTRDDLPESWAITQNNLSAAYMSRIQGERAENIERAIAANEAAITVYTVDAYPERWAATQTDLGSAYLSRLRGDLEENVEKAIEAYKAAHTIYTKRDLPQSWARTQINLAEAYRRRYRGDRAENLDLALRAFKSALKILTRELYPRDWASIQNNLGVIYRQRIRGNRARNLEIAIHTCEDLLTFYTRESFPLEWARVQNNLGTALADRLRGPKEENLERAAQCYKLALEIYQPDQHPYEARGTAKNLGTLYIERGQWDEAYSTFLLAIRAAEQLYGAALTEDGRVAEIKENASIYQHLVAVCLQLNPHRLREAFLFAEEGRSRLLRDQLSDHRFPAPDNIPAKLLEQEIEMLQAERSLENAIRISAKDNVMRRQMVNEAMTLRGRLEALWTQFQQDYAASEYVAFRRGEKLEWEDVQGWLAAQEGRVTLLEFFFIENGLVAFIVRQGDTEPEVAQLELSDEQVIDYFQRFLSEVHWFNPDHPAQETWHELLSALINDIMTSLKDSEVVYIVPHGFLHYLPLHAFQYEERPLIDLFSIVYIPSAAVALRLRRSATTLSSTMHEGRNDHTLVVGNPQPIPKALGNLPYAEEEASIVAKRFGVLPLLREKATRETVKSRLSSATRMHFAAHTYFDSVDPFSSGIVLAEGKTLTAHDFLTHFLGAELLVLSGCESARQGINEGDELTGLARSFLYAGIPSLALSLWQTNDYTSAMLMSRFYNYLYSDTGVKKMSTADALRAAMRDTRKDLPHTYYWAPFILYGDWR